ncbi:DNA-binding transcriptional regulator, LysR family [Ralstonia sp. 25mfcol4.1]|uniref:LysR family transcriptional regulator n=1 Tax=Ralstonia sp. 25mfcol4.1 TaxID=1761899 RepID=UPI00041095D7|nr:LysR family transcriptional regulator [Ralstonia sp. 25mfcol4.1]SDP68030.1 DNA-binding transcriptional regulator, LysR family [Ralstonia sp. 25mfcol4.1]
MNLSRIDLNLLVAFEALYQTRSVTLAGKRLNRAQPSVSNALSRLRALFGDELFLRSPAGMEPTQLAHALMPGISSALDHVRRAVGQSVAFDPAAPAGRSFTIAATDYADIVLLPYVIGRLRRQAPDVDLRIMTLDRAAVFEQLDQGVVDVAIGGHLAAPKRMVQSKLYEEDFVCIVSRSHPSLRAGGRRRQHVDLSTYLQLPHALFAPGNSGSRRGVVDGRLDKLGRQRRVAATFSHIVALPLAVAHSDLVATIARRVASRLASPDVQILEVPEELADTGFDIELIHSRRTQADAAAVWLRQEIRLAVSEMV